MKKDWILIGAILVFALLLRGVFGLARPVGEPVEITLDGAVVGRYPMAEDQIVSLPHHTVKIGNGQAQIVSSDCTGQDCVKTPAVSKSGQAVL